MRVFVALQPGLTKTMYLNAHSTGATIRRLKERSLTLIVFLFRFVVDSSVLAVSHIRDLWFQLRKLRLRPSFLRRG